MKLDELLRLVSSNPTIGVRIDSRRSPGDVFVAIQALLRRAPVHRPGRRQRRKYVVCEMAGRNPPEPARFPISHRVAASRPKALAMVLWRPARESKAGCLHADGQDGRERPSQRRYRTIRSRGRFRSRRESGRRGGPAGPGGQRQSRLAADVPGRHGDQRQDDDHLPRSGLRRGGRRQVRPHRNDRLRQRVGSDGFEPDDARLPDHRRRTAADGGRRRRRTWSSRPAATPCPRIAWRG